MRYRIFLAGATGVIGRRLAVLLRDAGHQVTGTTRDAAKADALRAMDVAPVVVDVFDAQALANAVAAARPEIVIHQLTDLPRGLDPAKMDDAIRRNARLRAEGTRHLVDAAVAAGARRLIAQSIAWAYAPGAEPHTEDDPLDVGAQGLRAISVGGVVALERAVLDAPLDGIVLRYGQLYGPDTGTDAPTGASPLHVDAAARAALLAIDRGARGVYNIAEPNPYVSVDKARTELGWRPEN
jgi:nucleoside-diphosphate-sugar epimerase